jgi:hypothetical protein
LVLSSQWHAFSTISHFLAIMKNHNSFLLLVIPRRRPLFLVTAFAGLQWLIFVKQLIEIRLVLIC